MFQSLTILRELVQSLAKVTLLLKHSVKLRHCISCGDLAACHEMACVLFVVQTDTGSATTHTSLIPTVNSTYFLYFDSSKTTMQLPLHACNILISLFGFTDFMHLVLLLSCLLLGISTYPTWTCQTNKNIFPYLKTEAEPAPRMPRLTTKLDNEHSPKQKIMSVCHIQ